MNQLISLGSINADFVFRLDGSAEEVETAQVKSLHRLPGGKAANVALLACRLGYSVRLLGCIGCDDLAVQALGSLEDEGVDLQGVACSSQHGTAVAAITVPSSGKKHILLAPGANHGWNEANIDAVIACIKAADHRSVLVIDFEITPSVATRAVRAGVTCGLKVIIDPSFPHEVDTTALKGVAALTPNEEEALALAGMAPVSQPDPSTLKAAAMKLAAFGVGLVCVKLDGGGCLWVQDGYAWHQQRLNGEVVDTTGAGDAFTGALAVALADGRRAREAVEYAVVATELAVAAHGSQDGYRTRGEIEARLAAGNRPFGPWPA